MRQILSTALVAVIVGALAGMTASAIAQTPDGSAITPSAVTVSNADRVDGKHAVGYTTKAGARKNRLVATNKYGKLPPNIVNPYWTSIRNKPAGFADGVDDQGVTRVTVGTHTESRTIGANGAGVFTLDCPAGKATGGGFAGLDSTTNVLGATSYADYYYLYLKNTIASADNFVMYVTCLTTDGAAVASKLTPAAKTARPGR